MCVWKQKKQILQTNALISWGANIQTESIKAYDDDLDYIVKSKDVMLHEITKKNQWTTKFPTIYLQGGLIGRLQGYPWVGWFIG